MLQVIPGRVILAQSEIHEAEVVRIPPLLLSDHQTPDQLSRLVGNTPAPGHVARGGQIQYPDYSKPYPRLSGYRAFNELPVPVRDRPEPHHNFPRAAKALQFR